MSRHRMLTMTIRDFFEFTPPQAPIAKRTQLLQQHFRLLRLDTAVSGSSRAA
jgi:hypothetical protein